MWGDKMKTETKPYMAYYEREVARYWELKKDKQKWNKWMGN